MTDFKNLSPNHIYSRRKRFLPEYREFFAALKNISKEDQGVRDRVIAAINGDQTCSVCRNKIEYMMTDATTQTEINSEAQNETISSNTTHCMETIEDTSTKQVSFQKRKRKRKRNCPKVVKTAQHSDSPPVLTQPEVSITKQVDISTQSPNKLSRSDSFDSAFSVNLAEIDESFLNGDLSIPMGNTTDAIMTQMKVEWDTCDRYNEDGLLPIHKAIAQNDLLKLKRQIYVWKHRKINLTKIITQDRENPIQLAIKRNCLKSIIDELLQENIDLNGIDDDSNTIIHLAVMHLMPEQLIQTQRQLLQILELFLNKIDLKILLEKNDDGLTALHVAVKNNNFLMAEKILSVLDERLELKGVTHLNDPTVDEKTFLHHYCQQCDNFEEREQNELKKQILNARDMKRGCTVLYFAIELKYEHIVYLLIAHMSNPLIKNLTGLDAKTYYADYGRNANITGALDKLTAFFQK